MRLLPGEGDKSRIKCFWEAPLGGVNALQQMVLTLVM